MAVSVTSAAPRRSQPPLALNVSPDGPALEDDDVGRRLLGTHRNITTPHRADPRRQLFDHDRLDDVVVGPGLKSGDDVGGVAARTGDDDRHLAAGADLTDQVSTVRVAEHDIDEQDVGLVAFVGGQPLRHVGRLDDLKALLTEGKSQGSADPVVILDEQCRDGHAPFLLARGLTPVTRRVTRLAPSEFVKELSHR